MKGSLLQVRAKHDFKVTWKAWSLYTFDHVLGSGSDFWTIPALYCVVCDCSRLHHNAAQWLLYFCDCSPLLPKSDLVHQIMQQNSCNIGVFPSLGICRRWSLDVTSWPSSAHGHTLQVIDVRQNVLVMDFLGEDSIAAPRLKDVDQAESMVYPIWNTVTPLYTFVLILVIYIYNINLYNMC